MKQKQQDVYQHGWFFRFIKRIVRVFKKRPLIVNLNDNIEKKAIFISNHSAASGPMILSLFFPVFFVPWGAHPMTERYLARWRYLYYIFYRQKLGYNKFVSWIMATGFAAFSNMLYNGMKLIPTYPDGRLKTTFQKSEDVLNSGQAILVFPEDSNDGYHDPIRKFHSGFAYFALDYHQKTKENIPIYPIYYNKRWNAMIIDKPTRIHQFIEQGYHRDQIAEFFKDKINDLKSLLDHRIKQNKK